MGRLRTRGGRPLQSCPCTQRHFYAQSRSGRAGRAAAGPAESSYCPPPLVPFPSRMVSTLGRTAGALEQDEEIDLACSEVEGLNAVIEREVRNYERNLVHCLRRCLASVVTAATLGEELVLSSVAEPLVPLADWHARLRCLQYLGLDETFFLALIEPLQDLWEFLRFTDGALQAQVTRDQQAKPFKSWFSSSLPDGYLQLQTAEQAEWVPGSLERSREAEMSPLPIKESKQPLEVVLALLDAKVIDGPLGALLALAQKLRAFLTAQRIAQLTAAAPTGGRGRLAPPASQLKT
eukprot:g50105.t1